MCDLKWPAFSERPSTSFYTFSVLCSLFCFLFGFSFLNLFYVFLNGKQFELHVLYEMCYTNKVHYYYYYYYY